MTLEARTAFASCQRTALRIEVFARCYPGNAQSVAAAIRRADDLPRCLPGSMVKQLPIDSGLAEYLRGIDAGASLHKTDRLILHATVRRSVHAARIQPYHRCA